MAEFEQLKIVNLDLLNRDIKDLHKNFIVNRVNESCLRLAVFTGEYPWHYHPSSDELFIVLEGELFIDVKDGETIVLKPHEMVTIPAGTIHRTRSVQRTVNLCFEDTNAITEFVK